jgi:DNA-binding PadR family transcriptional regulator
MLLQGPRHGYQLKQEAAYVLGQDVLHSNIVYPLLRRFTENGWVTRKVVPGERGQKRHQYAITEKGREALVQKLSEYTESDARSVQGFLPRVGMFQLLTPEARRRILDTRAAYLERTARHLAEIPRHFSLGVFARATTQFLQKQVEAELSFIQHLRKISK